MVEYVYNLNCQFTRDSVTDAVVVVAVFVKWRPTENRRITWGHDAFGSRVIAHL